MNNTIEERFWIRVRKGGPDDCWTWTGSTSKKGYGRFSNTKWGTNLAHRIAFMVSNGYQIPDGLLACHSCDNPRCVNPNHIFIGTNRENILDSSRKGRLAKGERAYHSKLTEQDVRNIHTLYSVDKKSSKQISKIYNVSMQSIMDILKGKSWKHLNLTEVAVRGKKGGINHFAKLKEEDILHIRKLWAGGLSFQGIASRFGVQPRSIKMIISRETWNHI